MKKSMAKKKVSKAEELTEREEQECAICGEPATEECESCDDPVCDDCCIDGLCDDCWAESDVEEIASDDLPFGEKAY